MTWTSGSSSGRTTLGVRSSSQRKPGRPRRSHGSRLCSRQISDGMCRSSTPASTISSTNRLIFWSLWRLATMALNLSCRVGRPTCPVFGWYVLISSISSDVRKIFSMSSDVSGGAQHLGALGEHNQQRIAALRLMEWTAGILLPDLLEVVEPVVPPLDRIPLHAIRCALQVPRRFAIAAPRLRSTGGGAPGSCHAPTEQDTRRARISAGRWADDRGVRPRLDSRGQRKEIAPGSSGRRGCRLPGLFYSMEYIPLLSNVDVQVALEMV